MKILKRSTCYSGNGKKLGGLFVSECNNKFCVVVHDETGKAFFIRGYETCLEAGLIFREILDYCVKFYERKDIRRTFWQEEIDDFPMFKKHFEEIIAKMVTEEFVKSELSDNNGKGVNPRIIEIMTQ
jgi:hypothetical protein